MLATYYLIKEQRNAGFWKVLKITFLNSTHQILYRDL
jgi:hypothetical protein